MHELNKPHPPLLSALKALGYQPVGMDEQGSGEWILWPWCAGLRPEVPPLRLVLVVSGTNIAALFRVTGEYVVRFRNTYGVVYDARERRVVLSATLALDATTSQVVHRRSDIVRGEQRWTKMTTGAWTIPWWRPSAETVWGDPPACTAENIQRVLDRVVPETEAPYEPNAGIPSLQRPAREDPLAGITWRALEAKAAELDVPHRRSLDKVELAREILARGGQIFEDAGEGDGDPDMFVDDPGESAPASA